MDAPEKLGTHQKALSINLNAEVFGSFAEIGAGQEVARWFLRVGGASGTVAKTISAYDKEVSDDLYGAGTRYVSKPRLQAMLDNEWAQLVSQLQATRGATTSFFSFVDTISARNFSGTNDCHGWVGLRFLQQPGGPVNDVVLHVNLRDSTNVRQQEAVGILGVNLLYAVQHNLTGPNEFLASVFEDLGLHRLEIDCLELNGPAFEQWNRAEIHAFLVTGGFAEAVVFLPDNQFAPPNEVLYKRALVLAPGRFNNLAHLHSELIRNTLAELPVEELKESKGGLGLFCLTAEPLTNAMNTLAVAEIAEVVKSLQKLGYGVMVFRSPELYVMSAFVNRYTKSRIHFAIGLSVLVRVMQDRYGNLAGALLEGIARLFTQNVRLVVYPMTTVELEQWVKEAGLTGWTWEETNGMVHAENLHPAKPIDYLYKYLLSKFWILPSQKALSFSTEPGNYGSAAR
jgi:hypothetical protein